MGVESKLRQSLLEREREKDDDMRIVNTTRQICWRESWSHLNENCALYSVRSKGVEQLHGLKSESLPRSFKLGKILSSTYTSNDVQRACQDGQLQTPNNASKSIPLAVTGP
ncbi:hypothetical protein ACHQM5_026491 [Ranunculus cassubicifolius]